MPFYEYQCAACGHHHEELQKVTDRPLRKCPACGRAALKRLVSAPVFRLKGGGWYETDFKSEKEEKRNIAGEKEPAAAEGPAAEKPKEDKPEAKPADKKPDAGAPAKPATAAKKPKPAPAKPARRRPARR
jgi:putative FmdB family regulatory protein